MVALETHCQCKKGQATALLEKSPPNLDIALVLRLAFHEHRHGQNHIASARLLGRLEGPMNEDRQDRRASTPNTTVLETQMDAQNEATFPLSSGNGGGLANGKDSMDAASVSAYSWHPR